MCQSCWDADRKEELIRNNEPCSEELKPIMTLNQLKANLFQQWLDTGKTRYRIFKDAIFDPPGTQYTWKAVQAKKDIVPFVESRITISFL